MSATTDRSVLDPVGVIVELVTAADPGIGAATVTDVVVRVAGGRAKQRRLAAALVSDPDVLTHGRSPAPRAVGTLLIALRRAGATRTAAPRCATCGKALRTLQRRGQDWLCGPCALRPEPCAGCGQLRHVSSRDRHGRPRCIRCPDDDGISDPLAAITEAVKTVDAHLEDAVVVAAVRAAVPDRRHHRKLARALVDNPRLLTGAGHLAPVPSVLRFIDALVDAGSTGVVRPACPRCHRMVRLEKPYQGQRICRRCVAEIRAEPCSRCGTVREPATRDPGGLPLCPDCLNNDEINQEDCVGCGRRRPVSVRTSAGPLCPNCRPLPTLTCAICGRDAPCEISRATGRPWCGACRQRWARCTRCGQTQPIRGGTRDEPLCSPCTRPEPGFWRQCPTCGRADRLRDGQCARCVLDGRLRHLLAGPGGVVRPELVPAALGAAGHLVAAQHVGLAVPVVDEPSAGRTHRRRAPVDP